VFTVEELPGLLLYDVYAPDKNDEDDTSDALRTFLNLIRWLIVR
jgi:hypothetical protein